MTLSNCQGHSNLFPAVEFDRVHHHTKFERDWLISGRIQATVKGVFIIFLKNVCFQIL